MEDVLVRSAKICIEVQRGQDILAEGHETARHLWNFVRYCCNLHGRQARQRFKWLGLGKLKYPGKYKMDKAFRDHWSARKLSDRCYSTVIQELDIAYRAFMSNRHGGRKARRPRYCKQPRTLFFEVGRNAKPLGDWTYRLTVLGGHIKERHVVVKLSVRPGVKMGDVKIIRVHPDGSGTIVYYVEAEDSPGAGVAALDLGIINLGVLAFGDGESVLYSGKGLLSELQWYQKRAKKCKPSGWEGGGHARSRQSKRLRSYRRKAANVSKLAVHNFTRSVIDECVKRGVGTLVVGDLTHIRKGKDYGKKTNQKLHVWPFREARRQLEYKGEEVGIEVKAVSEAYTSKTCHVCGTIGSRVERGLFKCKSCGLVMNADVNGAFGILNKVSPGAQALGVGALLPCPPSPLETTGGIGAGVASAATAKEASQIGPTFVAKFDLRNWSIAMRGCCNDREVFADVLALDVAVATADSL